jgi:hypothetical protein
MNSIGPHREVKTSDMQPKQIEKQILRYHSEGLDRFARVIDGNKSYNALMSHRLSEEQIAEFPENLDLDTARIRAIALAEKAMRKRSRKILHPTFPGFVCDGRTSNNLREFEFFERICAPLSIKILTKNYADATKRSPRRPAAETDVVLDELLVDIRNFYKSRDKITASLVHQQILYSKSFFNFLVAFTEEDAVLPAALVQANDHSPSRVALSMVLKGLNIPRIYLQHAEVSECFPPLDFEYSVLRNNRSLATYQRIGPIKGKTFVIARELEEPNIDSLFREYGELVDVVIYPTSRVNLDILREMIQQLKNNAHVSNVLIKEHPGAALPLNKLLKDAGVSFLQDFPAIEHVAIVGNSSVAIELIARGIPVYQNFDFDPVERDYYGFVHEGVIQETTFEELSNRFWRPYTTDEIWRTALSQWLPNMRDCETDVAAFQDAMAQIENNEQASGTYLAPSIWKRHLLRKKIKSVVKRGFARYPRLAQRIISRLQKNFDKLSSLTYRADKWLKTETGYSGTALNLPKKQVIQPIVDEGASQREFAIFSIRHLHNPAEWLTQAETLGVLKPINLIRSVDMLIQKRDPSIAGLFKDVAEPRWDSAVGLYTFLIKTEWINSELSLEEIDKIVNFIKISKYDRDVKKRLVFAAFPIVLANGDYKQLTNFISQGSIASWECLPFSRRAQVLRKLASLGCKEEFRTRLQDMKETATPLEALKLKNIEFLSGWLKENWNHSDAEASFIAVTPSGVRKDYHELLEPSYTTLRPRMCFMEIRTNPEQREELLDRIKLALISKKEFSCIRLSDREGYLFYGNGFFTLSDVQNCERHWWGTEIAPELRAQIIERAHDAIRSADVVGIPSVHRFIRDVSTKTHSLVMTLQMRGLIDVLTQIATVASPNAVFTEDKMNVGLLGDLDTVVDLASCAQRLVIVTSVQDDYLPPSLRAHENLHHIALPSHYKTHLNKKYVGNNCVLPHVYTQLIEDLEGVSEPGALVLVAGGVVGKILVGRARAKGAVAIDIGHVIDDWVGNRLSPLR